MGIYIKGIDKLKKGDALVFDGERFVYTDDKMQSHRYDSIEVPAPHGQLIDKDELTFDRPMNFGEVLRKVDSMQAVIDAER